MNRFVAKGKGGGDLTEDNLKELFNVPDAHVTKKVD